jgi:putative addiction module CopG family antidote
MNEPLTPQLERKIREKVESGLYDSAREVMTEALRLLDSQDEKRKWLREKMRVAEEQYHAANVHEDTDDFWARLDHEVDQAVARGDTPSADVCP